MDKNHKDPDTIDLNEPRHAQYMHKAWKKHQNTVYWVDINLALKKGLKFHQTRSNAIILYNTLPASHAQGARKTSRSQEIETRSLNEELFAVTQVTRKVPPKHVHLITARTSTLKIRQIMIEQGNLLFAVTQVTRKVPPKHVPLMKARTSTLKMKQIMIER